MDTYTTMFLLLHSYVHNFEQVGLKRVVSWNVMMRVMVMRQVMYQQHPSPPVWALSFWNMISRIVFSSWLDWLTAKQILTAKLPPSTSPLALSTLILCQGSPLCMNKNKLVKKHSQQKQVENNNIFGADEQDNDKSSRFALSFAFPILIQIQTQIITYCL